MIAPTTPRPTFESIEQLQRAVDEGRPVRWVNDAYHVSRDRIGSYHITYQPNQSTIGLTNRSGTETNGELADFYIAPHS